jgi:hypothetical protein
VRRFASSSRRPVGFFFCSAASSSFLEQGDAHRRGTKVAGKGGVGPWTCGGDLSRCHSAWRCSHGHTTRGGRRTSSSTSPPLRLWHR